MRAPYYPSRQESTYFSSLLHEVIRSQSGRTGFLDMSKGCYPSIDSLWQAARYKRDLELQGEVSGKRSDPFVVCDFFRLVGVKTVRNGSVL